jgi:hypothetical protein
MTLVSLNVRMLDEALTLTRRLWPQAGFDDVDLTVGPDSVEIDVRLDGEVSPSVMYLRTGVDTNDALKLLIDGELLPRLETKQWERDHADDEEGARPPFPRLVPKEAP